MVLADIPKPAKRSFIQRYFDREVDKVLSRYKDELAEYEKAIKLHNDTANLSVQVVEAHVTITELRFQRVILAVIILYLVIVIWKLIRG